MIELGRGILIHIVKVGVLFSVLVDSRAVSKITQGITAEIRGEGSAIAPVNARMVEYGRDTWARYGVTPHWTTLAGYWKAFERARSGIHLGTFVGVGGLRDLFIGKENRPAKPEELEAMKTAMARAMARVPGGCRQRSTTRQIALPSPKKSSSWLGSVKRPLCSIKGSASLTAKLPYFPRLQRWTRKPFGRRGHVGAS